ncbi:MAG TPA: 2-hydroxychromene-2-carboxylate isomerase [Myxococcales bacterium]|nr:2-hydroxychromene-2-carboxylate isomerase [Myxococcales bacterium]
MPKTFDFFYDLGSPYSYLASTQLPGIEKRTHSKARLLPITLGGLRKVTGHQLPPPQQLKYMSEDTGRWAEQYGVPMRIPEAYPVSTILALRACIAAERMNKGEEAMKALFHAHWAQGEDISRAEVVEAALSRAGLPGRELVAATQEEEIKDALRRNTDLALARGVFGVPMLFVGDRSFWGNDRLHFAEAELRRQQ